MNNRRPVDNNSHLVNHPAALDEQFPSSRQQSASRQPSTVSDEKYSPSRQQFASRQPSATLDEQYSLSRQRISFIKTFFFRKSRSRSTTQYSRS